MTMSHAHSRAISRLLHALGTVTAADLAAFCGVSRALAADWLAAAWQAGTVAWNGDRLPGGGKVYVAVDAPGALAWHFSPCLRMSRTARYPALYDPLDAATYRPPGTEDEILRRMGAEARGKRRR